MALKILGGEHKGLIRIIPKSFIDRPTSVILRRKIFDANQQMDSTIFVDLCAGTGMMGLEAFSRGAQQVWFVDKNRQYLDNLKQFIKDKELKGSFHFYHKSCLSFLDSLKVNQQSFHNWVFFLDPPYHNRKLYSEAFKMVKDLDNDARLWLEGSDQKGFTQDQLLKEFGDFDKIYTHGSNYLAVF